MNPYYLKLLGGANWVAVSDSIVYIEFKDNSGVTRKTVSYTLDALCSKYYKYSILYLNNKGAFDIYTGETINDDDGRNEFNVAASIYKELKKDNVDLSHLDPVPEGGPRFRVGDFCNEIDPSELDIDADAYGLGDLRDSFYDGVDINGEVYEDYEGQENEYD